MSCRISNKKLIWSVIIGAIVFIFNLNWNHRTPQISLPTAWSTFQRNFSKVGAQVEAVIVEKTVTAYNTSHNRHSSPLQHIAFIKTHKCASTTIQNILMRYGLAHNLTFMLPTGQGNHIGWPEPFDPQRHMRSMSKPPDILCYHTVFTSKMVDVMPNDTFYLTAVRDPYEQIVSSYVYASWLACGKRPLSALIDEAPTKKYVCGTPLHNPVMFDLGYPMTAMSDLKQIDQYVDMLDRRFHFVIVVEYFDESLIILRDMLGWKNDDILSFSKNFRQKNLRTSKERLYGGEIGVDVKDTEDNRAKVYETMQADTRLYLHFKRKIEKTIATNKQYISREVAELRKLRESWAKICIEKLVPAYNITNANLRPFGMGAIGYSLTEQGRVSKQCIDLTKVELSFVREIDKQYQAPG